MASEPQVQAPEPQEADNLGLTVVGKRSMASLIPVSEAGLQPKNFEDLLRLAKHVIASGAAPKGMTSEGAVVLAMQAGLERGMGPLAGLSGFVVINGVLSARGWLAKAFMQQSAVVVKGTLRSGIEGEGQDRKGWAEAMRVGYTVPFRRTFSVQDAIRAGLWKKDGPWQTAPDNMLEWRAVGMLARMDFGDVMGGIPLTEEAQDFVDIPRDHEPTHAKAALPVATRPDNLLEKLKAKASPAVPVEVAQARVEAKPAAQQVIDVTPEPPKTCSNVIHAQADGMCRHCGVPWVPPPGMPVYPPAEPPVVSESESLANALGAVCPHNPAREYLKAHKKAKNVVCEDCTLTVKYAEDGSLIVV
jgi:hypothetical protein